MEFYSPYMIIAFVVRCLFTFNVQISSGINTLDDNV